MWSGAVLCVVSWCTVVCKDCAWVEGWGGGEGEEEVCVCVCVGGIENKSGWIFTEPPHRTAQPQTVISQWRTDAVCNSIATRESAEDIGKKVNTCLEAVRKECATNTTAGRVWVELDISECMTGKRAMLCLLQQLPLRRWFCDHRFAGLSG